MTDSRVIVDIAATGYVEEEYLPHPETGLNGRSIYLAPAGQANDSNKGCDDYSENQGALETARLVKDELILRGYVVRIGIGDARDKIKASNDWGPDLHIPIHSNAGPGDHTPSGMGICTRTAPPGGPLVMFAPAFNSGSDPARSAASENLANMILDPRKSASTATRRTEPVFGTLLGSATGSSGGEASPQKKYTRTVVRSGAFAVCAGWQRREASKPEPPAGLSGPGSFSVATWVTGSEPPSCRAARNPTALRTRIPTAITAVVRPPSALMVSSDSRRVARHRVACGGR